MSRMIVWLAAVGFLGCSACETVEYVHVGPNWDALQKLEPPEESFAVQVSAKSSYQVGERMEIAVTSKQDGHVWLVQVGPDDEVELLFPNEFAEDNAIRAGGVVRVPTEGASWGIEADEPAGKSMLAAIVTTGDTDLEEVLGGEKSVPKALRLVEDEPTWGVAKTVIDVREGK